MNFVQLKTSDSEFVVVNPKHVIAMQEVLDGNTVVIALRDSTSVTVPGPFSAVAQVFGTAGVNFHQ